MEYSEWSKELGGMIKSYPLIKNKWKDSRFRKMFRDGLTTKEALRCWVCGN